MANRMKLRDDVVTVTKREYSRLKHEAYAYRAIVAKAFESPLRDSVGEVMEDFRATKLYTDDFLSDLEDGLRQSSYSKKYAHKAAKA